MAPSRAFGCSTERTPTFSLGKRRMTSEEEYSLRCLNERRAFVAEAEARARTVLDSLGTSPEARQRRRVMPNVLGYLIVATRDDLSRWYMTVNGGYAYFTQRASSAELFTSLERAEEHIAKRMGVTFLHNASGADNKHPVRRVWIGTEVVTSVEEGSTKEFIFSISGTGGE
jgi:hypothetical protein